MKQRIEDVLKLIGIADGANRSLAAFHLEEIMREIAHTRGTADDRDTPPGAATPVP